MTTTIGKWMFGAARGVTAAAVLGILTVPVHAQSTNGIVAGEEMQQWTAKDKPGDGKAEVLVQDGNDPMACRLSVSVKGGNNCTKVMCKGEAPVFTSSIQSKMAAKKIALSTAKAHYVHFLQEEINSKRSTDIINSAIKKEGGADAGTNATSGNVNAESIREQASANIKGFAVIEDGMTKDGNDLVAYVIGGVSCLTQKGADNLSAGNKTNNATGSGGGTSEAAGPAATPSRRRAGADSM
jgi:hypothetical protein